MLRRGAEVPDHQVQVFAEARVERGKSGSQVLSRPGQHTCRVAEARGGAFPRKKAYGPFYEGFAVVSSVRVVGPVRLANVSPRRARVQPQRSTVRLVALPECPQAGRTEQPVRQTPILDRAPAAANGTCALPLGSDFVVLQIASDGVIG